MKPQQYQPPKPVLTSHEAFLQKVGKKLETLRTERRLSIIFLKKELGISRNSYSLMEKGQIYFSLSNLLKILDYYNIPAEDFFKDIS